MTHLADPSVDRRQADRRAIGGVLAAAAAWIALLQINGPVWDRVVYDWLGFEAETHLGDGAHFFFYDLTKIALLLVGIIFAVTVLRSFVTLEQTRALLGRRHQAIAYVLAAVAGVITPFCSCSAVPVFIGFVAAGVPLGITMTFLIASPMVDVVAIALIGGSFGWGVAGLYVGAGVTLAIAAGVTIGRLGLERFVEDFVYAVAPGQNTIDGNRPSWSERFDMARAEVVSIIRRIWPFLVVAIFIGAAIHGWAPEDLFARYAGSDNPLAVPIAVALGIPLYSNAAGTIPLVEALHAKGVALGTALAFMMSVVALSLPEMVLLRRVLRPQLMAIFIGIVASGIVAVGLLMNVVL
jgi:hypothetical protein